MNVELCVKQQQQQNVCNLNIEQKNDDFKNPVFFMLQILQNIHNDREKRRVSNQFHNKIENKSIDK